METKLVRDGLLDEKSDTVTKETNDSILVIQLLYPVDDDRLTTLKPKIKTNIKIKCDGYTLHVSEEILDEIATYLHFRSGNQAFTVARVKYDLSHMNLMDSDFCGIILHLGWTVHKQSSLPADWWIQL